MATITVLKFDTPQGAGKMLDVLTDLSKEQLITVEDAAIVTWEQGKKKPKTRQAVNMAKAGALGGAFWGMLFGLLFFVPGLGLALGTAMGAISGAFTDIGIDDNFIKSVRDKVTEGTSALFLMTSGAVMDKVTAAVKETSQRFEIISTNLSNEEEAKLKAAFAEE